MHPTKTTIRRLAYTVGLVLTALAVFVPGTAAGSVASGSTEFIPGVTDFPSRIAASKDKFVPGVTDFPSRLGENGERAAEARLAERSRQAPPVYVNTDASGFDWSAAAAGAIAATLLLLGAALAVRVARPRLGRVAVG